VIADKPHKPKDIDFVGYDSFGINMFIGSAIAYASAFSSTVSVLVNNRNSFCLNGTLSHARITAGFWHPVCIFSVPREKFRYFETDDGIMIQSLLDVQNAAIQMEAIDHKKRMVTEWIKADNINTGAPYLSPDPLQ